MHDDTLAAWLAEEGYDSDGWGAAAMIRQADGSVVSAACGHARPGISFTTDTVSYTGSLAKQMVGVCTAALVRDCRLNTEMSVRQWIPELPAWAETVRIRHLIHHTSGLPSEAELLQRIADQGQRRWDSPAVLHALQTCPTLRFPPGSTYEYCNTGWICLVKVLERVTNTPFIDLARRLLFDPLGMQDSNFCNQAAAIPTDAATGNPIDEQGDPWPLPLSLGDGGAWSTAEDLHRLNSALLPGGVLDEGVRVLVHTPGELDDGRPLEYAWGVGVSRRNGVLAHSHGGNWPGGWTAKVIRLPDLGVEIAALANNSDVPAMIQLTDRIVSHYT